MSFNLAGIFLLFTLFSQPSKADLAFSNISADDLSKIVREMAGNSMYSSVSPASSLGKTFGFELGAILGVTTIPDIEAFAREIEPSASLPFLPHAAILGAVSIPHGFTGEFTFLPSLDSGTVSYDQFGGALKWTFTETFFEKLPFSLALKGYYTESKITFNQTINNATTGNIPTNVGIKYSNNSLGINVVLSKKISFFEPYAGFGIANASGKLSITGSPSASFFDPSFTTSQSAESKPSSTHLYAGINFKMAFFVFGLEYQSVFGTHSYNTKLSAQF